MNRKQIYICSAIFIALTLVRFTSPALADRISDGINRALYIEQEHTETAVEFGKSLADGDVIDTFLERFDKSTQPSRRRLRRRSRPSIRQLRRFWPLSLHIRIMPCRKR